VREVYLFGDVLVIQSLPFLAAAGLAVVEDTRFNSFAFWTDTKVRLVAQLRLAAQLRRLAPLAALLPRRAVVAVPPPAPAAENQVESA
jgi:hypothetical protein